MVPRFLSRPRTLLLILLILFLSEVGLVVAARPLTFRILERLIGRDHPGVRRLSTAELALWLGAPASHTHPLLLDVRTPEEFAVSHLAGARRIDPGGADLSPLDGVPRDTPIVAYCAIGYRSARLAERLEQAGFRRVWNLDGSLFAWANEGRLLVSDAGPATRVHPFDRLWGLLLVRHRRAPLPPSTDRSDQTSEPGSASPRSS